MGQFLNSINDVRKNYKKYDDWEQKQADERAKKEYLATNLDIPQDKVDLTQKRAETVIRATEIMDARSEDNCENVEQLTGILSSIPLFGIGLAQAPILNFADKFFTKKINKQIDTLQKESDKLGIEVAERNAKQNEILKLRDKSIKISKNIKTKGPFAFIGLIFAIGIAAILWSNSMQKKASRIGRYQAKQNELKGLENFVVYTPEQIEKAKEIAKKIPDEKERNSVSKMLHELKDVIKDEKAYKKWLAKKDPNEIEKLKAVNLTPAQLQRAQEDKELIVDAVKEINIKAEEYSENVENTFDTFGNLSFLAAIPLGFGINKLLNAMKAGGKFKALISAAIPTATALGIQLYGTVAQKEASRIGRYKARQDLMKNPARLMAYCDEDMKKAENIKADKQKQGFWSKLGDSFKFLKTYIKDKKEYKNYKKTTQKENEKLQKAFKQIETSDIQEAEAKTLQKNVFRAFDEVDEMSQRYSEDVEAGTEIAKQLGLTAWSIGSTVGLGYLALSVISGKFPIAKLGNWLTNLTFDAKSPIKQGVNNLYSVLKSQDKTTVQKFQKALATGKIQRFLDQPENKVMKDSFEPIMLEFGKIGNKGVLDATTGAIKGDLSAVFTELFKSHFKQTALAKWTRNMVAQSTKLWARTKLSNAGANLPKEALETLGMNYTYKNYKTLTNTAIIGSIPILGTMFAVPYAFNAWLTNIQKKAGKIGIMKAMDKIDDPRVFAEQQTDNQSQTNSNFVNKLKP